MQSNIPIFSTRTSFISVFSFILFFSFNYSLSSAQELSPSGVLPKQNKNARIYHKPGHVYNSFSVGDSIRVTDTDLTEVIKVIVEFKAEPMVIQQKLNHLNKVGPEIYQQQQSRFTNDLSALYRNLSKAYSAAFSAPQKGREYYKVFNGVSLSVPRAMISGIASLPYVKKVHLNKSVKADLAESVKIIGADSVWSAYNDKGDSVVIGILDTGIDYMHPALGKGFGKGFKVIGGYDFVNKDDDPRDDNGHGTHVAGIAAADGDSIKGVAPKALLVAYKVLNAGGAGEESDIIAAIEKTVDPNDDGNTDDKLDVVNMSLGSNDGNSIDAMSVAVNNAVRSGVTFCVSAGNGGDYNRIGSPGTAELAITVGASDKKDKLAVFSSKGPAKKTYIIKPEILAPGQRINSSFLHGQYIPLDGTSMASPHIAGVCALLKHKHKDWTPWKIKSAIMSSAKDLGLDVMSQGTGRVNALKAMNVKTFISPSLLNYGLNNQTNGIWTEIDTVSISNDAESEQSYNVSVKGLTEGITLSADQNSFTLQPKETKHLLFTLAVDNFKVPFLEKNPNSYSGIVRISGTKDTLRLPWAFARSPLLYLTFDMPFSEYMIYNQKNTFHSLPDAWLSSDMYSSEMLIPSGFYKLAAIFLKSPAANSDGNSEYSYVFKDSVYVYGYKEIKINSSEADNLISFNGVDENGRKLSSLSESKKKIRIYHMNSDASNNNRLLNEFSLNSKTVFKCSKLPFYLSVFAGEYQNDSRQEHKIRIINYPVLSGLSRSVELKNSPQDFVMQNIRLNMDPDAEDGYSVFANTFHFKYNKEFSSINMDYSEKDLIKDKCWEGALYLTPQYDKDFWYSAEIFSFNPAGGFDWFSTEEFRTRNDSIMCFAHNETPDIYRSWNNGTMIFGDGPIMPAWTEYNSSAIQLAGSGYQISVPPTFWGQLKELRSSDLYHSVITIYDEQNNIVRKDTANFFTTVNLPKGKYKYEAVNKHYTVAGRWGKATLLQDIDKAYTYMDAPGITTLRVLNSKGAAANILDPGEKGRISFSVRCSTYKNIDTSQTKLYLKKNGTADWEEIKISNRINHNYLGVINTAEIGKFSETDSSLIDMKIVTRNINKSKTEWILEPAFAVGKYAYSEGRPDSNNIAVPNEYKLYNNYPNPFNPATTITYSVPERTTVMLKIYDILGREVTTLVNKEQSAGEYKVKFNGSSLPSGIYIYSIQAGQFRDSKKLMILK